MKVRDLFFLVIGGLLVISGMVLNEVTSGNNGRMIFGRII